MPDTEKSYLSAIEQWPILPPGECLPPGRVAHLIIRHDSWCKTLNGGTGADCNCNPTTVTHLQPEDV